MQNRFGSPVTTRLVSEARNPGARRGEEVRTAAEPEEIKSSINGYLVEHFPGDVHARRRQSEALPAGRGILQPNGRKSLHPPVTGIASRRRGQLTRAHSLDMPAEPA